MSEREWSDLPILPYVRMCYRFNRSSFFQAERRLLDYLILYMEKGRYLLNIEGIEYELLEGEFALIQPGLVFTTTGFGECIVPNAHFDIFYNAARHHSFVTTPGQTNIASYATLLQPRLNDFSSVNIPVKLRVNQSHQLKETLLSMIEHFKFNDIHNTIKVQSLATELILLLLEDRVSIGSMDFEEQQFVNKMSTFLSYHLSTPLSVSLMAQHVGYSESHFSTLFLRHFGTTPHQYLMRLRLDKARDLLVTTNLKMEQIAEYCGFANASHLSKTFKKESLCSPRQFRSKK